jgi:excinuclease ABC subunit A
MENRDIVIKGAREHNLRNIDVVIPRNRLCVITGLSGSGKSSLAFDTLYSEGQRRYVESLSAYARQFLGLMEKPDVDLIEGLSPAISIEQKSGSHNPRSTVGTVTEIYDFLRLLFARTGTPTCYNCGRKITRQSVQDITDSVLDLPDQTRFQILSPVVTGRKGEYRDLLEKLQKDGFLRVAIDGKIHTVDEQVRLKKNVKHTIEVVVDRLIMKDTIRNRLTDSLETALKISCNGTVIIDVVGAERLVFSERLNCPVCNIGIEEISPRIFSFNSPFGACEECKGLGYLQELDPGLVVPDPSRSLRDGAVVPWNAASTEGSWNNQIMNAVCEHFSIPLSVPYKKLSDRQKDIILNGSGDEKIAIRWRPQSGEGHGKFIKHFEGVIPSLLRRYRQTSSQDIRRWIEGFMTDTPCPSCNGCRLKKESRAVRIGSMNICECTHMPIERLKKALQECSFENRLRVISDQIIGEISNRLDFLINVGVGYLTLDRMAATLSGGEAQRIRLATQIGSRLTGVIYILDEPSIGLHARDNRQLIQTLFSLRDLGNTVVVIEHDRDTMLAADHIIDIGPGAGVNGGNVVAQGTPQKVQACGASLTGKYLSGKKSIPLPSKRRAGNGAFITLREASGHNLKSVSVDFPLGTLICVTGVSGSGKSSLINETLYPALSRALYRSKAETLPCHGIRGIEYIDKVIDIDQSPIGRTPRSNPATYTKTFDQIRSLFAALPESKIRGYSPGRFSFNLKGGRCEACEGGGVLKIEMHFLPDVYIECESCHGKRYNRETLEITFKGKNIADVLDMTVEEAVRFFDRIPSIKTKLSVLSRVGLGYIHLGQQATTLSGGEAQRIKLATELAKRATGQTLYILDEPTTGLHFEDILMLLKVINELVDRGNTVIIIEHNLDVIKCADYCIDLGPEGGDRGGTVVACGTPEEIVRVPQSYTGKFLASQL